VRCAEHGVVVAAVSWARPGAGFSHGFEDMCAWLAAHTSAATAELMRVVWRSVTAIVERVVADVTGSRDLLAGVARVGIDEIAHRRGHRYLTVVVDHDTGRLIWAAPGRDRVTVEAFFDALGPERAARITHVSADGAEWIHAALRAKAPQAVICLDAFHIPKDLTMLQRASLAGLAKLNSGVCRGYLLKEQMRATFAAKGDHGRILLAGWLVWAKHSQLPPFVKPARTIEHYKPLIVNTLVHELSNARSEATNTHLRTLTKRTYGFHTPEALIAMAMLTRGGCCPPLPGRN